MSITRQLIRGNNASVEAATLLAAQYAFDTTKNEATVGTGTLAGGVRLQKKNQVEIVVPAQLVANTNDYSPTGLKHAAVLAISTDASRDVTGIVPLSATDTTDGREITIYNAGSFNAVLKDQSGSSSAANRFDLGGADITLSPKQSAQLRYRTQGALNRWEIVSRTDGQAVSDGSISARKLAASALGGAVGMINGTVVESRAGGAATFALKTLAGTDPSATDPVLIAFQNGAGGFVVRSVTAALSLTISSGSSMGFVNSTAGRLWILAIDTGAGTVLGAVNCRFGSNVMALDDWRAYSTTAEGGAGAADSAQVIYSAAAQASKFIIPIAFADYDSGLAAAGTWGIAPTSINLASPSTPRPGHGFSPLISLTAASSTGTTLVPFDDTIPQNTEGDQYLSLAITPRSACNLVAVEMEMALSSSVINNITMALFQDSIANALAAVEFNSSSADFPGRLHLRTIVPTLTASVITFKGRAGGAIAGTTTLNGQAGTRRFGGVASSFIILNEIMG